jgi:cytochrome b6-f complex iron-sulfur subunit
MAEKPAKSKAERRSNLWVNRRDLLTWTGWMGVFGFFGIMLTGSLRFLFPRVLFEPPTTFKAGSPDDYAPGEVSEKFKKEQRVWIVRGERGVYALLAVCTHLGCTPRWLESEQKFKCPCHGSGFYKSGVNFEGPAPRPLERVKIFLDENGDLMVDKGTRFRFEKGQWDDPGAIVRV